MGLFDKFKELIGIEEIEDDDEEEIESPEHKSIIPQRPAPGMPTSRAPSAPSTPPGSARSQSNTARLTNQFKMLVIEPHSFDESPKLVDSLKARKPVIINLENLETDTARKIFDFLSGATYALNGNVQKVANNIFVFAPENVNVDYNAGRKVDKVTEGIKSPWR